MRTLVCEYIALGPTVVSQHSNYPYEVSCIGLPLLRFDLLSSPSRRHCLKDIATKVLRGIPNKVTTNVQILTNIQFSSLRVRIDSQYGPCSFSRQLRGVRDRYRKLISSTTFVFFQSIGQKEAAPSNDGVAVKWSGGESQVRITTHPQAFELQDPRGCSCRMICAVILEQSAISFSTGLPGCQSGIEQTWLLGRLVLFSDIRFSSPQDLVSESCVTNSTVSSLFS